MSVLSDIKILESKSSLAFMSKNALPLSFYLNDDVVAISKELLGKGIFTIDKDGVLTGGIITETEAYRGPEDKASHAWNNRRTLRTEPMFQRGGVAYVYLCYGIHKLFNVVTNKENIPHAILLRGIEPIVGIETILLRRKKSKYSPNICAGPGSAASALGIELSHNYEGLSGPRIWICDLGINVEKYHIISKPRIGVDYAGEDALLPWNFKIQTSVIITK